MLKKHTITATLLFGCSLSIAPTLYHSASAYDDSSRRIKQTAHQDKRSEMGDPMIITWSIVPDGTRMPNNFVPSGVKKVSDFIAGMDKAHRVAADDITDDLQQRPWFKILEKSFDKYASKTGLTYIYEPHDTGDRMDFTSSIGKKGSVGDVRIGGLSLASSTLDLRAYSGLPGGSGQAPNIVFNTSHKLLASPRDFDFLLVHENMHNVGINHILVNSDPRLTAIASMGGGTGNGPQFNDLLGLHRRYGDVNEKGQGNDTVKLATDLGEFSESNQLSIGMDAGPLTVKSKQTDFVSIDGSTDLDVYKFTIAGTTAEPTPVTIDLTPRGSKYEYVLEGVRSGALRIDASKLTNLSFTLINSAGRKVSIDETKRGEKESYSIKLRPDDYYIEVKGRENKPQFYSLEIKLDTDNP